MSFHFTENNELSILSKRKLAEAHLGILRTREELGHLLKEMRRYLEFYRARIVESQKHIILLENNEGKFKIGCNVVPCPLLLLHIKYSEISAINWETFSIQNIQYLNHFL